MIKIEIEFESEFRFRQTDNTPPLFPLPPTPTANEISINMSPRDRYVALPALGENIFPQGF